MSRICVLTISLRPSLRQKKSSHEQRFYDVVAGQWRGRKWVERTKLWRERARRCELVYPRWWRQKSCDWSRNIKTKHKTSRMWIILLLEHLWVDDNWKSPAPASWSMSRLWRLLRSKFNPSIHFVLAEKANMELHVLNKWRLRLDYEIPSTMLTKRITRASLKQQQSRCTHMSASSRSTS